MSQTPIYDQLRGERINVDVPAAGTDRPQPDPFTLGTAELFARPPGPGVASGDNPDIRRR